MTSTPWWVYRCSSALTADRLGYWEAGRACGIYQATEEAKDEAHEPPHLQGGSDSRDECGHPWNLDIAMDVVAALNSVGR